MSDGLTDMKSQPDYTCSKCGFVGTENHFYKDYSDNPTICIECFIENTEGFIPSKKVKVDDIKKEQGIKFDTSKLRYDLIPPEIKLYLAEILTHGAEKYAPNNWKYIEVERYIAAFERHFNAWQLGEEFDKDSEFHHLKHALTNMMFIVWLTCADKGKK